MSRCFSLVLTGAMTVGGLAVAPSVSRADFPFGIHLDVGRTHIEFGRGDQHHHHPRPYVAPYRYDAYRPVQQYGYYNSAPVVVPSYNPWSASGQHHNHGKILVPHNGHYHVRPY